MAEKKKWPNIHPDGGVEIVQGQTDTDKIRRASDPPATGIKRLGGGDHGKIDKGVKRLGKH